MNYETKENVRLTLVIAFICLLVGTGIFIGLRDKQHKDKLMAECMKDHKEYECYSMLRSRSSTTVVPIYNTGR